MTVELRQLTRAAEEGWATLFALAEETTEEWILVGGQLMFALAVEHRAERIRPTEDIDVVVNLRVRPDGTEWLSTWLEQRDFVLEGRRHRTDRPPLHPPPQLRSREGDAGGVIGWIDLGDSCLLIPGGLQQLRNKSLAHADWDAARSSSQIRNWQTNRSAEL